MSVIEMEAVTLTAFEALVLAGSYHIALTIFCAFSVSEGLCVLVGAGCNAESQRCRERGVTCNFYLPCWDSRKPLSWRKVNCCCDVIEGTVHKHSSCSRVRWETTADTADEINLLCCLIISGTSLSLSICYQSFFMLCSFEGKQEVSSTASWECPP